MPTILIADDSRLMQRNLTMTLQQAGYDLLLACDGREALSLCMAHLPDLALLDCIMPELSGQEVCVLLRNNPTTKHIPVILMSSEDWQLRNARYLGAQAALFKPIETKELLHHVTLMLAPMPVPGQRVTLTVDVDVVATEVLQVVSDATILVRTATELALDQKIVIHYDMDGGLLVSREGSVYALESGGTVLHLGPSVTAQQRRRHFRKKIEIPVRYRLPGDFYRLGTSLDVSGGGMRLMGMGGQLEVGTALMFQLIINPSAVLTVQGVIRRVLPTEDGRFEVGVEFLDIDPNVQEELTMFLFASASPTGAGAAAAPPSS